jgi:hypothetical protein
MKRVACSLLAIVLWVPSGNLVAKAEEGVFPGLHAASGGARTLNLDADGVAFGSNSEQVARLYDRYWDRHFVARYRKANPGPKTAELDYELAERKKVLRRVTTFDLRSTTYDTAEFKDEFARGNGETMTSVEVLREGVGPKQVSYTRRFFFSQDRLWKTYDEYRLEPQGPLGADFKEATERVAASLGPSAKRTRAPESPWETVAFDAGTLRVRLIKLPKDRVALVRADAALAREVLDRRAHEVREVPDRLDPDTQAALR